MRFRALSVLVTACSIGACFSFGDLSGGGSDDAGSGSDATAGDTGVGGDALIGSDAAKPDSDSSFDAGPPFCLGQMDATFCADFDEVPDATAGFSSLYRSDGGITELDTTAWASPPASFRTGNLPLLSGTTTHGALVRATGITPTNVTVLNFDIRIDALASQGTQVEALALVYKAPTRSSLQINLASASSVAGEEIIGLDGGVTYYPHPFTSLLQIGKWMHVTITVAFTAASRTLTVIVDGEMEVSATMNGAFVAGPLDLYLGNAYSPGPSDGSSIHYDNVSLSVE